MSTRADLIAACHAAPHPSPEWEAAVCRLGAASRTGFPAPKAPRSTGLNSGELIYRLTQSHVFDKDRAAIRARLPYASHSHIIEWLKVEVRNRKQAESAAKKLLKQAP